MHISKFLFTAAIVAAVSAPSLMADDFDLSSQRVEEQLVKKVPGEKIDHQGIVINPTPQSLVRGKGVLNASKGFKLADKQKAFAGAREIVNISKKGAPLAVDFGKASAKAGVKQVPGAYLLEVTPAGAKIVGYDEAGAFYGLQTLRQLAAGATDGRIPAVTINDFPTLKYRGVVEGFYGTPWSHKARLALLDFYGRNKLNDYIYGPKDDPYHSSPYWRQPYPADQAQNIRELVASARKNQVNFVWAIHPGKDIRWTKEDYDSLVNKFEMMYDLGVRSFAIFFDDIDGIGTDPVRQAALVNDLTRDFVIPKGDVTNILICPTDYSQAWAKPGPDGPLAVYGRDLNPNAEVFWTGAVVCSDLTPETLQFINSRIKRPALYWWNYPVTDYCKHILLQGPVYGLDTTLTPEQVVGIESNPMEHAEASRLALYGVADYAWNIAAYNPIDNWERGLAEIMPGATEAYRTFAIHSTDTEDGYRRDESWETETFPYNNYTPQQFNALKAEFERIQAAPVQIRQGATNQALIAEMSPWLVEFEKLGRRGLNTLNLIKVYEQGNPAATWNAYAANTMTAAERRDYNAHKIGTMKLQPFYENAMMDMGVDFYKSLTGNLPAVYNPIGSYATITSPKARLMLDGDSTTYYHSGDAQVEGHWIGVDLMQVTPVSEIEVLQGRNSDKADVDFFDHATLEASADGKEWTPLIPELTNTYIIRWTGEPVNARYVRLRRLDSKRTNWTAVREFAINPINPARFGLDAPAPDKAIAAFDANPLSAATVDGYIAFNRTPEANTLIVLGGKDAAGLAVSQFNAQGQLISTTLLENPYSEVALLPSATRLYITGAGTVNELIQK